MKHTLFIGVAFGLCLPSAATSVNEESNNRLSEYTLHIDSRVRDLAISPDGRTIAVLGLKVSGYGKAASEKKFREEIDIWDWESSKLSSSKLLIEAPWVHSTDFSTVHGFVRFADNGARLIVYARGTDLLVMDPNSLVMQQRIAVGASVLDLAVDSRGLRAALLAEEGSGRCEVRVYDLSTGTLLRKWPIQAKTRRGSISVDPRGKTVAVGVEEFIPGERKLRSGERNVFVYDADSGLEVTSINTGYVAGAVRLTGNGTLLSVSGNDTHNNRDPLRIWDAQTGKLIGEITNPQEGIHHALEVSTDGRVVVASIGLEQYKAPFLWMEGVSVHKNDRLRFWDLSTERVLATTPFLHTVLAGAPLFRLSPDGMLLVVNNGGLLSVFKLNHETRGVSSESR